MILTTSHHVSPSSDQSVKIVAVLVTTLVITTTTSLAASEVFLLGGQPPTLVTLLVPLGCVATQHGSHTTTSEESVEFIGRHRFNGAVGCMEKSGGTVQKNIKQTFFWDGRMDG